VKGRTLIHYFRLSARFFPWLVTGGFILAIALYEVIDSAGLSTLHPAWHIFLNLLLLVLLAIPVYLISTWLAQSLDERIHIQERLVEAERIASNALHRLALIFRARQQLINADSEEQVVEWLMHLATDITEATGASFVPIDEHGQPVAVTRYGETPTAVTDAWLEYLASPAIRGKCNSCENHNHLSTVCPLLSELNTSATGIYCLPLRRGEREYGVLNLYISNPASLDDGTRTILQSVVDDTALVLEGVWLRQRELGALRQLQAMRQRTDLGTSFSSLLEDIRQTLEADFAYLMVGGLHNLPLREEAASVEEYTCGEFPEASRPFVAGILKGVLASGKALSIGDLAGASASPPGVRAILAAPLNDGEGKPMGALVVGNRRISSFYPRQLGVLHTIAGQLAMVVQNTQQLTELEYRIMVDERRRLAREIHDGLAQTLGFLKLQVAQMKGYLESDAPDRLRQAMDVTYKTLSDAYQETRSAIDGLRISPYAENPSAWLEQVLNEFQENNGQRIQLYTSCETLPDAIPSEVHTQLVRILQETLSNIRKHSSACQVWVNCGTRDCEWILEVRDDGRGFCAEDVPKTSQHGLRGMRERADLIGAEFQIISQPGQGTTVRISLPVEIDEVAS
jgi:two-component system nitrate/nitrite sensor histidine kinase NarX